jgi:hypothetical protein
MGTVPSSSSAENSRKGEKGEVRIMKEEVGKSEVRRKS